MPDWVRNRVRQLIVVFVGMALLVVGGGLAVGGGSGQDETVPWVDQPVAKPSESITVKAEPRPVQAPCRAKDIESLWPEGGSTFADTAGGSDAIGVAVLVRNVGPVTCTLTGHPGAQGLDRDGKPLGPPAEHGKYLSSFAHRAGVATIEPGEPARFFLSMSSAGCGGPERTYSGVKLSLDNGYRFTIKNAWLQGTCPLKVSGWEPATSDGGRYWALEARVRTPPSAEVGSEFSYVLELINITAATVRLEPCLIFTHAIGPESTFDVDEIDKMVHSTRQLNCSANVIGPRKTVTYEMRMRIPEGFPTGETLLHWTVEGSPRPFASTMFLVTN